MNEVASRPRKLQPYVVESTELKENLEKWKWSFLPGKCLRPFCVTLQNRCSVCLVPTFLIQQYPQRIMTERQYISTGKFRHNLFCVDNFCVWNYVFYIFTTLTVFLYAINYLTASQIRNTFGNREITKIFVLYVVKI